MENKEIFENLGNILGNDKIPDNLKDIFEKFNNGNSVNSQDTNTEKKPDSSSSVSPEMLQNLLGMLNSNKSDSKSSNNSSNIDIEMIMKMKNVMDKMNTAQTDPRSSLLLSLKPYLKNSRKDKVEQYIKLFNMTKVMEILNSSGGDFK